MAFRSDSTTKRNLGTMEIRRNTRRIRSDLNTASGPLAGISAMVMMMKSKTFHGSRKNREPCAYSLIEISTTNTPRTKLSSASNQGPAWAITTGEVSSPSVIALMTISTTMLYWTRGDSTQEARRGRDPLRREEGLG